MTAAIFGLLGVVIGGVLSGVVTWYLDRHREKKALRAAARLVMLELSGNAGCVAYARRHDESGRLILAEISSATWYEHRPLLASTLDDEEWFVVAAAYMTAGAVQVFGEPDRADLNKDETTIVAATGDAIQAAVDRLGPKALPTQKHRLDWQAMLDKLDLTPPG